MGRSSKEGQVFYLVPNCPYNLDGTPPSGGQIVMQGEITDFDLHPSANLESYAHDKSYGWEDTCAGAKKLSGTISVKTTDEGLNFGPGEVTYLKLYPYGRAFGSPLQGYAVIEATPVKVSISDGKPVAATFTFKGKGRWTGLPNDALEWGGFECTTDAEGSHSART